MWPFLSMKTKTENCLQRKAGWPLLLQILLMIGTTLQKKSKQLNGLKVLHSVRVQQRKKLTERTRAINLFSFTMWPGKRAQKIPGNVRAQGCTIYRQIAGTEKALPAFSKILGLVLSMQSFQGLTWVMQAAVRKLLVNLSEALPVLSLTLANSSKKLLQA